MYGDFLMMEKKSSRVLIRCLILKFIISVTETISDSAPKYCNSSYLFDWKVFMLDLIYVRVFSQSPGEQWFKSIIVQ